MLKIGSGFFKGLPSETKPGGVTNLQCCLELNSEASPPMLGMYVAPQQYLDYMVGRYFFFPNLQHKIETGMPTKRLGNYKKTIHLDQSNNLANQQ